MRARPLPMFAICLVSAEGHFVLAAGWRQTCCNAKESGSFVFFALPNPRNLNKRFKEITLGISQNKREEV